MNKDVYISIDEYPTWTISQSKVRKKCMFFRTSLCHFVILDNKQTCGIWTQHVLRMNMYVDRLHKKIARAKLQVYTLYHNLRVVYSTTCWYSQLTNTHAYLISIFVASKVYTSLDLVQNESMNRACRQGVFICTKGGFNWRKTYKFIKQFPMRITMKHRNANMRRGIGFLPFRGQTIMSVNAGFSSFGPSG